MSTATLTRVRAVTEPPTPPRPVVDLRHRPFRRRRPSRRPVGLLVLVALAVVFSSSCTVTQNETYDVSSGLGGFYGTVFYYPTYVITQVDDACHRDPYCTGSVIKANTTIEGWGAAQWIDALDNHAWEFSGALASIRWDVDFNRTWGEADCLGLSINWLNQPGWGQVQKGQYACKRRGTLG